MSQADKERWDKKYQDTEIPNEAIKLVRDYAGLATSKRALDIACGMGRHSKYLAKLGFIVDALDISSIGISSLQGLKNIHAEEVDFDTYVLAKEKYELIVCTYFLERKLFHQIINALKPNAILLFETFIYDEKNERVPSNPSFLLQKGELQSYFENNFEIIVMKEWWDTDYTGKKVMKISMVAKKKP